MLRTRTLMAGMLSLPVNAVLFGTGAVAVLSIPELQPYMEYILPATIALAFALTWPIAWKLAPRLRARTNFYPNLFRKS
jgi:hypothetical protein